MSMQTLSTLLAAFLTFVIGWSVLLRDRKQRHYRAFLILCLNLTFWYLAAFFAATLQSNLARWIGLFFAIAIPSSVERFFRVFLADDPKRPSPSSKVLLTGTGLGFAYLLFGIFYAKLLTSFWYRFPLFAFIFGGLSYCVYLIYERQRAIAARSTTSRSEALRLTYLLYGGAATVTLAATDFLPEVGLPFPTLGNLLTVIYMYFFSQTLFRTRLLDVKELLGKMVTLSALVLILSVIYGLLLAWVGPDQQGVFFFNTVVASFVILVIFEPLRGWLEDQVNRWLFAEQHEFSRRVRLLIRGLANIIEIRPLVSRILRELEETGRVTHVSIYLVDPSGQLYYLAGHVGPAPLPELDGTTRRLFLERLRESGILTREGMERELAEAGSEDVTAAARNVHDTMEELLADVCVPLISDGQLLGILGLRDDRLREAYATDELELLRQVAAQAAITLRNSKIYERMKERERLAALGQMAAGLAHEIRNPLGAIKGAAQLLKASAPALGAGGETKPKTSDDDDDDDEDEDEQEDDPSEFLDVIVEEVDRLGHVVSQFLGYARPDRGLREPLSINDVVRKTLQLVRSEQGAEAVEIETNLGSELPEVRGDAERLRQVFLNLIINGSQAMGGRGKLTVQTRVRSLYRGGRASRFVEISFRDQGAGIEPKVLQDIFIPFFTTKEGGTGLGLPICQRIIENHGGLIEVRSEPGKGATFAVLIPLAGEDVTGIHTGSLER